MRRLSVLTIACAAAALGGCAATYPTYVMSPQPTPTYVTSPGPAATSSMDAYRSKTPNNAVAMEESDLSSADQPPPPPRIRRAPPAATHQPRRSRAAGQRADDRRGLSLPTPALFGGMVEGAGPRRRLAEADPGHLPRLLTHGFFRPRRNRHGDPSRVDARGATY